MYKVTLLFVACLTAVGFGICAWSYLAYDYLDYCDGVREEAGGWHIFWSEGPVQSVLLDLFGPGIRPFMGHFQEACRPVHQKIYESGIYKPQFVVSDPSTQHSLQSFHPSVTSNRRN